MLFDKFAIFFVIFSLLELNSLNNAFEYIHEHEIVHEKYLGKCGDFLQLNNLLTYCQGRDDDCYMSHHKTRCYCDHFCTNDCCDDHKWKLNHKTEYLDPVVITNIDLCVTNQCKNGGTCIAKDGVWRFCICHKGFSGVDCQKCKMCINVYKIYNTMYTYKCSNFYNSKIIIK